MSIPKPYEANRAVSACAIAALGIVAALGAAQWLAAHLALLIGLCGGLTGMAGLRSSRWLIGRVRDRRRRLPGDLLDPPQADRLADLFLDEARLSGLSTSAVLIEVGGLDEVTDFYGERSKRQLRATCIRRLRETLRDQDRAYRLGDMRYLVLLSPGRAPGGDGLVHLSKRLQSVLEAPFDLEGQAQHPFIAVGAAASDRLALNAAGADLIEAARLALEEALCHGPSSIRCWSDTLDARHRVRIRARGEIGEALANGQIQPYFQPQICTSTGRLHGVEALARWVHPTRGVLGPGEFLDCLEKTGRLALLGEVMRENALSALCGWDRAGLSVPRVSVNLSMQELEDPRLADRLKWDLDRHDLPPHRLGVEILETVVTDRLDGAVLRNITRLAEFGCQVDLDDFGTGHASINALRKLPVSRLKIDRSFVSQVDRDDDQRKMICAILSLAEGLGLETLAEGVESVGEHALLAQLGCHYVQGYGIARPMPAADLPDWLTTQDARISQALELGRRTR